MLASYVFNSLGEQALSSLSVVELTPKD
jgi:hypothetical protein